MSTPAPASPSPPAEPNASWSAGEIALLLAPFVLVWGAYVGLRASMPSDALAPFRSGLYWPDAGSSMLAKGGGLLTRVLLHVGFTFGLGIVFVVVFVLIRSALTKSESRSRIGVFVCFGLAFLIMLGVSTVPNRMTRIDEKRGELVVAHMVPVPPFTTSIEEMPFDAVHALGARLGVRGTKYKERVVRLFAIPKEGEPLELGEAECPGADAECLEWADPAAAQIAKVMGWKGKLRPSTKEDGKLRQYE